MAKNDTYTLWENEDFSIVTPNNPGTPYSEGLHVVVSPKRSVPAAWKDIDLATAAFQLALKACAIIEATGLAPWMNIQANGNWGLLPGNTTFFHVHIHGRNKTQSWGKPVTLPDLPGTYHNDPMPEKDRKILIAAFRSL